VSPKSAMVMLAIALVIAGAAAGYAGASLLGRPAGTALQSEDVSRTSADLAAAMAENAALRGQLALVSPGYLQLNSSLPSVSSDLSPLDTDRLQIDVPPHPDSSSSDPPSAMPDEQILQDYLNLSKEVQKLRALLLSYAFAPDAFPRVLNDEAVKRTRDAVLSATSGSSDEWDAYQGIYRYVTDNIKYAYDIEMPYISDYQIRTYGGHDYVTGFLDDIVNIQNYVQSPDLTLRLKSGDCEDQTVLVYAMMKYYTGYMAGTDRSVDAAYIRFSDGSGHMAIAVPVEGGKICIIDTTGGYLTSSGGKITSKPALQELQSYSDFWAPQYGPITYMALYRVNTTDGSYTTVASGSLAAVASTVG